MPFVPYSSYNVYVPNTLQVHMSGECSAFDSGWFQCNYNGGGWSGGGLTITYDAAQQTFFVEGVPCSNLKWEMETHLNTPEIQDPSTYWLSVGVVAYVDPGCCGQPGPAGVGITIGFGRAPENPQTPGCSCPCSCYAGGKPAGGDTPDSPIGWPFPGKPVETPDAGNDPVRYSSGEVMLQATDLASSGFGFPWGHTRSFAPRLGLDWDLGQGYNWQVAHWPQLVPQEDESIAVIGEAQRVVWFDWGGGTTYGPRYGATANLVRDVAGGVYSLSDTRGNVVEFDLYTRQFARRLDPAGNTLTVVARQSLGELPSEVQRTNTDSEGTQTIESYLYAYATGSDSMPRVTNVVLRRSTDGGSTWTNIRQAVSTYWTDADLYGAEGDLKL